MFRKTFFTLAAVTALGLGAIAVSAPTLAQPARPARPAAPEPTGKAPVVSVTGGRIQGVNYDDVSVYRGVPFAAAPVGDLRWRAPQPVKAWNGVRDAAAPGSDCTQAEDCLFLNVYKPVGARPGQKLPVMFWIHGGAFTFGSGAQYDASRFARTGVVVVTINYRLGRTGWFAHPAITKNTLAGESTANWGLQDQLAALKWVQRNIGAFGGDKNNVTIFGESAGGISVNFLMTLTPSHGLFDKAIAESSFGRFDPTPLATAEQAGAKFFATKGITGDSAATLAAMRAVPFSALQGGLGLGEAGPIMDGKLITEGTEQAFDAGHEMKIPYMLGGNSNEASLFPTENPAQRLGGIQAQRDQLMAAYDPNHAGDANKTINLMVTDYYIGEPDRALARAHVKNGQTTYRYFFSYLPPAQRGKALGLSHGGELAYVFGMRLSSPEDLATSQEAVAYWSAFAKYGDPGAAGGVDWPQYTLQGEPVMQFGVNGLSVNDKLHDARLNWMERNRLAMNQTP